MMTAVVKYYLLVSVILLSFSTSFSQLNANFVVDAEVCLNQHVNLTNSSTGVANFVWDFCHNDLSNSPQASILGNLPMTSSSQYIATEVLYHKGEWLGFAIDIAAAKLIFLNYGSNLATLPVATDLGNLNGNLTTPSAIELIEDNGIYYAFMLNAFSNNLVRVTFGNGLKSAPTTIENLGNFGNTISTPFGLNVIKDNGNVYVFVANYTADNITVINFGASAMNSPISSKKIGSGSGILNPVDIKLVKESGNWYGLISSLGNSKMYSMNLGNDPYGEPVFNAIGTIPQGTAIQILKEGFEYVAFVKARYDGLYRIQLGANPGNITPLITSLGNVGGKLTNESRSLKIVRATPGWRGFTIDFHTGRLITLSFAGNCTALVDPPNAISTNPLDLKYKAAGKHYIELTAFDATGNMDTRSASINVLNSQAPNVSINSTMNQCVGYANKFTLISSSPLDTYEWTFDDGNTSTQDEVENIFTTSGEHTVKVLVTATNTCKASAEKVITLFDKPHASFNLPSDLVICTNQQLVFTNTTSINSLASTSWKWFINNTEISNTEDLVYSFNNTASQEIKLTASIPGCEDSFSQNLNTLKQGPSVDFHFTPGCEDEEINFDGEVDGTDVTGYLWNFADGKTSEDLDVKHVFENYNQYNVSLTAFSQSGCNNSKTQTLTIHGKPDLDFTIDGPPSACSGSQTQFNDFTTDAEGYPIEGWLWDFGDNSNENAIIKSPKHIFTTAGDYNVTLEATTKFGCKRSLTKSVSILPSIPAEFTNSLVCENLSVKFTPPSSPQIVSYYWNIGNAYYDNVPSPDHTFKSHGTFPASLKLKSSNNCISTFSKNIIVPKPLTPDFSVLKNCINQATEFADITTGVDAVNTREWSFEGSASIFGNPVDKSFLTTGSKSVSLKVTGQSGCSYTKLKSITILNAPEAAFTLTPQSGAAPLDVQFTNTSQNAESFEWNFNDNSPTEMESSPQHTFVGIGSYEVELLARSGNGCEDRATQIVKAESPLPDADVKLITISENPDGTLKVIITLQNKGNTVLKNIPVDIDISGNVKIQEIVEHDIMPSSSYNFILDYNIFNTGNINFLCASAEVENDRAIADNRYCTDLDNGITILKPSPNPATTRINIEWISPKDSPVEILLTDLMGKSKIHQTINSENGFNSKTLDVQGLEAGLYILRIKSGSVVSANRIFISGKN